ncbi:MAG: SLBB domain-containing protein [Actinomycetota bacterium]
MLRCIFLSLLLLSSTTAALCAPMAAVAATNEYAIQNEDVIAVRVSGEPALSQNYVVDEKGYITLGDQVGKVRVAGLSSKQAQQRLNDELKKYLKVFEVSVLVVGETGSRALVYGEVAKPGAVKLRQGARLLDVLSEAGQPTDKADKRRITVARRDSEKSETVDLDEALRDPTKNLAIFPGDSITVPSRMSRSVRVDGEVVTAGPVALEDAGTAYAAVLRANPKPNADWARIVLRRKDSAVPMVLDLSRVRTGQLKDDLKLEEGDQLTVMTKFAGTATVRGEVTTPGEKDLNGSTQLWDFILKAGGGFTEKADRKRVQIVRDGQPAQVVDLVEISSGTRRSDDPKLLVEPGDVVFVPTGSAILRGEVATPGEKVLGNSRQLGDFIRSQGGGFTDLADRRKVQIIRDGKTVETVDLTLVASGQRSPDDPKLEVLPGDTVFIPNDEKNRFVIVGGVKKPGSYPIKPGMSIFDALQSAEGFSERATRKKIVIAPADRFGPDGQLKSMNAASGKQGKQSKKAENPEDLGLVVVDLKKLQAGDEKQYVAINPGDRIFIPEEAPQDQRRRKPSFLESVTRLLPFASLFMGAGVGYGGFGYGGFGGYGY